MIFYDLYQDLCCLKRVKGRRVGVSSGLRSTHTSSAPIASSKLLQHKNICFKKLLLKMNEVCPIRRAELKAMLELF